MGLFDLKNSKRIEEKMLDKQIDFQKQQNSLQRAIETETLEMQQLSDKSDLIKWQQNLEDEWIKLKFILRGYEKVEHEWKRKILKIKQFDPETKKEVIVDAVAPALANDLFINDIEPQVEPFLSRNLINSNLDEKRILMMLKNTSNEIADAIADGFDKYDIDFINADLIMRLIKNTIIPAPFRALLGQERKINATISKRIESFNAEDQQKNKGFFKFK